MASMTITARQRMFILVLLILMNFFAYVDRSIFKAVGQVVKTDLSLTDAQIGILQGLGFAIFYGLFGIPLGRLADRSNRSLVLSGSLFVWSAMTAACGLAAGFWTMLLARIGVGAGEAGATNAHSLISDLFPPERRATALSIFALGAPLGIVFGMPAAAWVAEEYGWRTAFFAAGVPGILLALSIALVPDIPRGHSEGLATQRKAGFGETFSYLLKRRSFLHLLAAISFLGCGIVSVASFATFFLIRNYGIGITEASVIYGFSGLGSAVGVFGGGFIADRLARRDERFYLWVPMAGTLVGGLAWFAALQQSSPVASGVFMLIGNMACGFYMAPSWAVAQNLALPNMRSTAAAVVGLAINVVASAVGPALLGYLSDRTARHSFAGENFIVDCPGGVAPDSASAALAAECARASSHGLWAAMMFMILFFAVGALHFLLASRRVRTDLAERANHLEDQLADESDAAVVPDGAQRA